MAELSALDLLAACDDVPPEGIAAFTFTERAAEEFKHASSSASPHGSARRSWTA